MAPKGNRQGFVLIMTSGMTPMPRTMKAGDTRLWRESDNIVPSITIALVDRVNSCWRRAQLVTHLA